MKILESIKEKFGPRLLETHEFRGDETVVVGPGDLLELLRFLKEEPEFDFNILMDLTAVDYLTHPDSAFGGHRGQVTERLEHGDLSPVSVTAQGGVGATHALSLQYRFEVVYHLYSLEKNHRLRVKVPVEEKEPSVPSATVLWPAANWYEREVWDMFGIRFAGHPNLKRILLYEEFVGHPLRKDYPVNKRQPLIGPKN